MTGVKAVLLPIPTIRYKLPSIMFCCYVVGAVKKVIVTARIIKRQVKNGASTVCIGL